MYQQIKQLADEALAQQNKDRMDAALRGISALCDQAAEQQPEQQERDHQEPLGEPEQHGTVQAYQQPAAAADADIPEGGAE